MESSIEQIKERIRNLNILKQTDDQADIYLKLAWAAEELLENVYATENRKPEFPIDIEMIGRSMGIKVEQKELNKSTSNRFNKILGQLLINEHEKKIEVDNKISHKTQQYAIAHSIGRCLLLEKDTIYENSYAIPLMPSALEEIAADKIALFLLLPLGLFKKEFKMYLDSCKERPLDVDSWLQFLSEKTQTTMFNLAIGYQQLKTVTCLERLLDFEKSNYDFTKFQDEYSEIFA